MTNSNSIVLVGWCNCLCYSLLSSLSSNGPFKCTRFNSSNNANEQIQRDLSLSLSLFTFFISIYTVTQYIQRFGVLSLHSLVFIYFLFHLCSFAFWFGNGLTISNWVHCWSTHISSSVSLSLLSIVPQFLHRLTIYSVVAARFSSVVVV